MDIDFKQNNKRIIETQLILVIENICKKLKISLDQWYLDGKLIITESLFIAIRDAKDFSKTKNLLKQYDDLFQLECISNKLSPAFHSLRKLSKINKQK